MYQSIPSNQPVVATSTDTPKYPIKTLRIFGCVQIILGILVGILSVAGIIIDGVNMGKTCTWNYYYYTDYTRCDDNWSGPLLAFDITCLIFSGWFILSGLFPFCMTERRQNSWRCLKITFMVCCIVGSSFFVPTVFALGVSGALMRGYHEGALFTLPSVVAVLSLAELVIAIVAASYCCCCSSNNHERRRLVYVAPTQQGIIMNMPNSQIPNPQGPLQTASMPAGYYPVGVTTNQYHAASAQNETTNSNVPPPYKE